MNPKYKQLENENIQDYIIRLAGYKLEDKVTDLEWADIVELAGLDCHYDSLRKAMQPKLYGAFDLYKYAKEMNIKNNSSDEYMKELDKKKNEVKLETIKLRDKMREINKVDYAQARFENLKEVMLEELSKHEFKNNSYKEREISPNNNNKEVVASVLISDLHLGMKYKNSISEYNVEIAKNSLNKLWCKIVHYCKLHKVTQLNIELLGDLINGIIHTGTRVQQEEDAITNIMTVSNLLVEFINDIKPYVNNITVYSVFGNHGRLIPNKNDSINIENVERLIPYYIESQAKGVNVIHGESDYLEYNIFDRKVVLCHGDKDNPNMALNNFIRILGYVPDEIHLGHLHSMQIKDDCDTEIVVNGSIVSTDDYALSIRKSNKPSQIMRIYTDGDDICTYKLVL